MIENLIAELERKREKLKELGGEDRRKKQHDKGKLDARERLELLFDDGIFMELDPFVKHRCVFFGMDKKDIPAEGVICAVGTVNGRVTFAFSQDFTSAGGSVGEMGAKKMVKTIELAARAGAPVVGINDGGGARIQEGVDALSGYGHIFMANAKYSGVIPQIAVIAGPCAGGAAYSPALMDMVIVVDKISQMFITGPQVIKAVTGETISAEELGGADVHFTVSGNAHFKAPTDKEAINLVKLILSYLPQNWKTLPQSSTAPSADIIPELDKIIPIDPKQPYNMKDVINLVADSNTFLEFYAGFAPNAITGFARIEGKVVGIVANQPSVWAGSLDINAADKISYFVRLCNAYNIPIVNLIDVPGFLPGVNQEFGGIIRHGAKMLYAYAEATVPKVSIILRKAYGGAYLAMCSKEMGADFVFAWPTAEIAVMGPEGAVNIVFKKEIAASDDPEKTRQAKIAEYREKFSTPYFAASRGYIDNIIKPSETKVYIANALKILETKMSEKIKKKAGLIPL